MAEDKLYPNIRKCCGKVCCLPMDCPSHPEDLIYCNPACKLCNPPDMVNHPPHYKSSPAQCSNCGERIECIEVVRHMPFNIGNAIKYLWRFEHKGGIEDLKKARWYIYDEIQKRERENDSK
jgi:hypothetical protein